MENSGVVHMLKTSKTEGIVIYTSHTYSIYTHTHTHTLTLTLTHSHTHTHTHTLTDLACMYKLFVRVEGGLACIVKCLSTHLRETGRNIVTEEPGAEAPGRNATTYVQSLLDVHDQYMMFLERSFSSAQIFKHAIQSVSETMV